MSDVTTKGAYGGLCNRTACQRPEATYFNRSTQKHYCHDCAELLNRVNAEDAQRLFGGPLCIPGTPPAASPSSVRADDPGTGEPVAYAVMLDGITQSLRRTKPSAQHIAAGFQSEDLTSVVEIVPLYPESTVATLRARLTVLERTQDVMQSDVGDLLRALGLPDHARPVSCHALMQADIKQGILELREVNAELETELRCTSEALGEGPYASVSEHAAALRSEHAAVRAGAERWQWFRQFLAVDGDLESEGGKHFQWIRVDDDAMQRAACREGWTHTVESLADAARVSSPTPEPAP